MINNTLNQDAIRQQSERQGYALKLRRHLPVSIKLRIPSSIHCDEIERTFEVPDCFASSALEFASFIYSDLVLICIASCEVLK